MSEEGLVEGEQRVTLCESCVTEQLCTWGVDPFNSEIYHDDTLCWLCDDCDYQRRMDI